MAGPMGYDKGTEGLRVPNEVELPIQEGVYSDKTGPHVGKRCVGNSTSGGCWYCIVTSYRLIPNDPLPPHFMILDCYCDWYRVHDMIQHTSFLSSCAMYNTSCW